MLERLMPVPEPYLKSMPSVLARPRIESMVSSTELMKHAEHCGCASTPTLNQTGELNDSLLVEEDVRQLGAERVAVRLGGEVAALASPAGDGVGRRGRSAGARERSRSGVPSVPRKYFETTTLVAICDQDFGISTSFCSKTMPPPRW